jgi:glycosyltransferase involved in cell wall biosynthesis
MNKINLLYDATIILRGQTDNTNRTGIYYCSLNILEELRKHNNIKIYLHSQDKNLIYFSKQLKIMNGLKFIGIQETSKYEKNIHFHLNTLTSSNNILLNIITLLKIIKNVLYIILENEKTKNIELDKMDAFFSPWNYFPKILNDYNIKKFILLYDVTPILFPDYFPPGAAVGWREDMTGYLDKNTYCFCISQCTKNDYVKFFRDNLDESKMTVTYISSARRFRLKYDPSAIKYIINKYKLNIDHFKYVFSFCSLEHRKNLIFTVKCFIKFIIKNDINDLYFLLGGEHWDNFINQFNDALSELSENYRSKIIRLGYVDDSDVNILYSNSLFFTYLSQYEGFGMPLLEAMQAGTPVISSNNSSLLEVTGDAAITIDYQDESACIDAMETFYFKENIRKDYIKKGIKRAKLFSWEKTVDLMCKKIKERTQKQ